MTTTDLHSVVISVSDMARSLAFYRDLLGFPVMSQDTHADGSNTATLDTGGGHILRLVNVPAPHQPTAWIPDDLQAGLRHIAFKVCDVDATTARLKAASIHFTLDPFDAVGGVRIAFFLDPDSALVEIVQGELEYHATGPAFGRTSPRVPEGDSLLFDHVAVTVSDLEAALAFYRDQLGCEVIGQLFFENENGFKITYLSAGTAVLELFSFTTPTQPNVYREGMATLGLKRFVLTVSDPIIAGQDSGLHVEDGTPFEWIVRS